MKFLALATTLLATASATIVYPYEKTTCSGDAVGSISACGCTNMSANYKIRAAKLNFQKATASFYKERNCVGVRISKDADQCVTLPFGWEKFGSVRIFGGTC